MSNVLIYLSEVALAFSVLYLSYKIALSKLTFHSLNRYLLLSLIPISLLLPLINIATLSMPQVIAQGPLFESLPFSGPKNLHVHESKIVNPGINHWLILTFIYCLGLTFSSVKLFLNIKKLLLTKQQSKTNEFDGFKMVFANTSEVFSFFNWIFIPKNQQESYSDVIVKHEIAHIRLKHSFDIILTELFVVLLWFNPLLYLYRKSVRTVHEYQADRSVLKKEIKTSHYLQLLLQSLEVSKPNNIYNYFYYPTFRKRIHMITKTKSTPFTKLLYLILLPACMIFLFAFATPNIKSPISASGIKIIESNSLPPSLFPIKNKSKDDITSFFGVKRKNLKKGQGRIHHGIDIKASIGTPIVATADGIISKAKMEGNWGNLIVISHSDGFQTWYAHLDGFTVKKGQAVKKGDVIGTVGNTGLSTGPHLHYEVRQDGKRMDPMDYFTK